MMIITLMLSGQMMNGMMFSRNVIPCYKIVKMKNFFHIIEPCDEEGNTALHLATKSLNLKGVEELLHRGAHENALNKNGRTPIMEAVLFPSEQLCDEKIESLLSIINMLSQVGANVSSKDKDGKTAKCYVHERLNKLGFFDRRTIYYNGDEKLMQTYEKIGLLLSDPIRASE